MHKKLLILLVLLLVLSASNVFAENNEVRYEAEEGEAFQCNNVGTYVAQIDLEGSYVNLELFDTDIPGVYKMKVYYAAAIEGTNTHTLFVNDENVGKVTYPQTSLGWGTFSEDVYVETEVTLKTGSNYIRFERTADDIGFAELDAISLTPVTLYTPDPASVTSTPTPTPTQAKTETPKKTSVAPTSVIIDNDNSFNYLYIVIPVAIVIVVCVAAVLLLKKKAK